MNHNITVAILLVLAAICWACSGCIMAPGSQIAVNVFSSRLVSATGTNSVTQAIEGGANLASNNVPVQIPVP